MKRWACVLILFACAARAGAQEYRVVYENGALPELYNSIAIHAEIKDGAAFKKLSPARYKLSSPEAQVDDGILKYNRQQVYNAKGRVHMNLHTGGRDIPLVLQIPVLEEIRINLYTDSIKPILNYYLNVEGHFSNGRTYPLDDNFVAVSCDAGSMRGLEWIAPANRDFDRVNFTIVNKFNPSDKQQVTVYLKKYKDPRDNLNYHDRTEDEVIHDRRRR